MSHFRGKTVLVTGAGGSIGSVLCQRIAKEGADELRMLNLTEGGLYNIDRQIRALKLPLKAYSVLGSVTDDRLVEELVHKVDIVIHAAAHKHVPICEANPLAAIENNIGGTHTLGHACMRANVGQFLLISTDKAVKPSSVMGATKRVAELIIRDRFVNESETAFLTVRFGNVMDSAGSVMPLWREQIENGGPVTVTDARCERFFMSIPEAVGLITSTLAMKPKSGLFVLDMGKPRNMAELAREMITRHSTRGSDVEIKFIGLRPGEKLTEELDYGGTIVPTTVDKVMRVDEPIVRQLMWLDIHDLLSAAATRQSQLALAKLWSLVR
jgi:FlaA1/EpsC-like NDP-sugar epimerase